MGKPVADSTAVVTSADRYMGPAIAALLTEEGAAVTADTGRLYPQDEVEGLLEEVPDILVINLAEPPRTAPADAITDEDWDTLFDALVHPLMRLVRKAAGPMKARGSGKIIAVTSAAPLRGIPHASGYCAARGAQNAFIRATGLELAKYNIQVNAIAQNYVRNDTYYPDDIVDSPGFSDHLERMVPTKQVAEAEETAHLALYLASPQCTHLVGQIIPMAGGWVTTTG
ncbi:MAG: SDR family oxidoreductase [Halioglobus sp.]